MLTTSVGLNSAWLILWALQVLSMQNQRGQHWNGNADNADNVDMLALAP